MSLDQRELHRIGARTVFHGRSPDLGYLVHSALGETFKDAAPGPFAIEDSSGDINVLAYGSEPVERYRDLAARSVCRFVMPQSLRAKQMPDRIPTGAAFAFQLRACPVVRKGRGAGARAGQERDVYLEAVEKAGAGELLDRRTLYLRWLSELLARSAGAKCCAAKVVALRQAAVVRRGEDRSARNISRPDVIFEGRLSVEDGEKFRESLRTGLGRHKAFGFGMLLLKRAR